MSSYCCSRSLLLGRPRRSFKGTCRSLFCESYGESKLTGVSIPRPSNSKLRFLREVPSIVGMLQQGRARRRRRGQRRNRSCAYGECRALWTSSWRIRDKRGRHSAGILLFFFFIVATVSRLFLYVEGKGYYAIIRYFAQGQHLQHLSWRMFSGNFPIINDEAADF